MTEAKVLVCGRCGSLACVGKPACCYDGYAPHGTALITAGKAERETIRLAEEARLAAVAKAAEAARIAEEARLAEQARLAEEALAAEEQPEAKTSIWTKRKVVK